MTISVLLPWLIAALAVAVALAALARIRTSSVEASQRELGVEKLRDELRTTREQLKKAVAKQRRSGEELVHARRKLEKTKKRVARIEADPRDAGPSRSEDPGEALETARQARDAARNEARELAAELERLRAEANGEAPPEPLLDNPAIEALQKRLNEADGELGRLRNELAVARTDGAKLKEKIQTEKLLYVSIRGELQVKKDRLRAQTEENERLRALKVVVDTEPA